VSSLWSITGSGGDIATDERWELIAEVRALEAVCAVSDGQADLFLEVIGRLNAEVHQLRAENAQWRARVTLGGIPPVSGAPHWRNVAAPPVPSASDNSAPPLRRSDTSSSAHRARVGEAVDHVHAEHGDVLKRLGGVE
jgi:hypothetical protein